MPAASILSDDLDQAVLITNIPSLGRFGNTFPAGPCSLVIARATDPLDAPRHRDAPATGSRSQRAASTQVQAASGAACA